MKLLNKLKALKKDKKGFTLIEIVIVIVIIAILAAMLVPSMLSWIDKANQRTFLSACDTIRTSVSTVLSDNYANGKSGANLVTSADNDALEKLVGKTVSATAMTSGTPSADKVTSGDGYNVEVLIDGNKVSSISVANGKYRVLWSASATGSGSSGWNEVELLS